MERFKYIHHTTGLDELYDLVTDRDELQNLTGRGVPAERELREAMRSMLEAPQREPRVGAPVHPDVAEELRALGHAE